MQWEYSHKGVDGLPWGVANTAKQREINNKIKKKKNKDPRGSGSNSVSDLTCYPILNKPFSVGLDQVLHKYKGAWSQLLLAVIH